MIQAHFLISLDHVYCLISDQAVKENKVKYNFDILNNM